MSWDDYVKNLLGTDVQDAVICGFCPFSVWAAHGPLCKVTSAEVAALTCDDHSIFYTNGLTIAGQKCSMIRDNMSDSYTMDVRTKAQDGPTYNVTIGKTNQAIIIAMGKEGVHGGAVNTKVHNMVKYLRERSM